jgi:hypothetical protein
VVRPVWRHQGPENTLARDHRAGREVEPVRRPSLATPDREPRDGTTHAGRESRDRYMETATSAQAGPCPRPRHRPNRRIGG